MRFISLYIAFLFVICFLKCYTTYGQDSITDFDGNKYPVVKIGDQVWMAQNLNSTHDAAGNEINGFCFSENPESCRRLGRLYSWDAMMNGSKTAAAKGICPKGWHLPSDTEWGKLFEYAGGIDLSGKMLRKELKFINQFGGNYFPATNMYNYGMQIAYYWSSSVFNANVAWMVCFGINNINASRSTVEKSYCFSVRCVKD